MTDLIFLLFIFIALAVVSTRAFIVAKEGERVVIFRLDKLMRVAGPGLVVIIPFVDRAVKVKLDIAEWSGLSEKELEERVVQRAMTGERD